MIYNNGRIKDRAEKTSVKITNTKMSEQKQILFNLQYKHTIF